MPELATDNAMQPDQDTNAEARTENIRLSEALDDDQRNETAVTGLGITNVPMDDAQRLLTTDGDVFELLDEHKRISENLVARCKSEIDFLSKNPRLPHVDDLDLLIQLATAGEDLIRYLSNANPNYTGEYSTVCTASLIPEKSIDPAKFFEKQSTLVYLAGGMFAGVLAYLKSWQFAASMEGYMPSSPHASPAVDGTEMEAVQQLVERNTALGEKNTDLLHRNMDLSTRYADLEARYISLQVEMDTSFPDGDETPTMSQPHKPICHRCETQSRRDEEENDRSWASWRLPRTSSMISPVRQHSLSPNLSSVMDLLESERLQLSASPNTFDEAQAALLQHAPTGRRRSSSQSEGDYLTRGELGRLYRKYRSLYEREKEFAEEQYQLLNLEIRREQEIARAMLVEAERRRWLSINWNPSSRGSSFVLSPGVSPTNTEQNVTLVSEGDGKSRAEIDDVMEFVEDYRRQADAVAESQDASLQTFAASQWRAWTDTLAFGRSVCFRALQAVSGHLPRKRTSQTPSRRSDLRFRNGLWRGPTDGVAVAAAVVVPWHGLLQILTHVVLFASVQSWISCHRQRDIWLQANGMTRTHFIKQMRGDTSWWSAADTTRHADSSWELPPWIALMTMLLLNSDTVLEKVLALMCVAKLSHLEALGAGLFSADWAGFQRLW